MLLCTLFASLALLANTIIKHHQKQCIKTTPIFPGVKHADGMYCVREMYWSNTW